MAATPPTVINFFNPTDVIALANGWIIQSGKATTSTSRASGLNAVGDEEIAQLYGPKTALTLEYENHTAAEAAVFPVVGAIMATYHIDSFTFSYQAAGWPKLSVQCHLHSGAHVACANTFTSTLAACPIQFGIPRELGAAGADWKMGVNDTGIGIASMSYTMTCTHQDEADENGAFLAAENRDGVETLDIATTGIPASVTVNAAWDSMGGDSGTQSNTTTDGASYSYVNHVARDAEA